MEEVDPLLRQFGPCALDRVQDHDASLQAPERVALLDSSGHFEELAAGQVNLGRGFVTPVEPR